MSVPLWQLQEVRLGGRLLEVTLAIPTGVTAVLGQSGAGKTSLLNLLVGFERPDAGTIVPGIDRGRHRLPLFWVPQDEGLWPHLTVRGHLETVGGNDSDRLLAEFDLAARADGHPDTLSQGERARLAVARALAADAAVLVMDEPLAHVDPTRTGKYWESIRRRLAASGASLVFATHSPKSVLAEARHVVCLKDGRVRYAGAVPDLYWRPATPELAECFGESNWLDPDEARLWLQRVETGARCFRPEQVDVVPAADGPLVVESSRFQGSVAEVELRHEPTGARRRFWHRPSANHLEPGRRVVLKALLALMLGLYLAACGRSPSATLNVREFHTWAVPSDGLTLPAPRSVALGREGEVAALDTAGRVLVYGPDGTLRRQWRMPDIGVGKPEGIGVLRDGRVVVCDTHYHRVVVFDSQGKVLQIFGREGRGPGEFIYPVAVTTDDQENLYIGEYGSNDRVQKFTRDGRFLLAFGAFGTKPGEFQRPSGIVWRQGQVYVADAFNNRIQVFADDGKFERVLRAGDQPLALRFPYDLRLGPDDALYVIEYGAARLSKVSLAGQLLGRYGSQGAGAGQFATPWGITVNGAQVLVADTGNRRLVELRFQ